MERRAYEAESLQSILFEDERQLRQITDNVPALIARMDTQARYVFANRAYQDLLRVPLDEVVGRTMREVLGEAAFETLQPYVERVLSGEPVAFDRQLPYRTIGPRFMHVSYVPERGPDGDVTGFLVSCVDISECKRAEARLQEERDFISTVVDTVGSLVVILDRQGRVVRFNRACEQLTGYASEEVSGKPVYNLVLDPEEADMVKAAFQDILAGKFPSTHENHWLTRDGGRRLIAWSNTALLGGDGGVQYVIATGIDITEREALLSETERLLAEAMERADRDPLTGLLNHRAFHKRLAEEADRAQRAGLPLAVAMVDLNNFRFFNDAYGHVAGDDVLRRVAGALQRCCRSYDTLARFGGDEFALLLPGLGIEETALFAARLRGTLDGMGYRPPGYGCDIPLNLSVGTAVFPDECVSRLDVVGLADARLGRVKSGGDAQGEVEHLRADMSRSVGGFTMLDALVTAVDNKDRYTRRHSEDVLAYSLQIAEALGLDERTRHTVAVAALLHDVGKIGVPDAILRKPGALTEAEFEAVRQHPMMGAIIVGAVPGFEDTLDAVRHHHERWDGGGYPFGLRGEETPLLARLMAVADAFSAMTTDRPYRKGMDPARALTILQQGSGTQWDPVCVQAFLAARTALNLPPAGAPTMTL